MPGFLADAPELLPGLDLFLTGFNRLDLSRPLGMEAGPISWFLVEDYCDRLGYFGSLRERFHTYIKRMDKAYLKQAKKPDKGRPNGNKTQSKNTNPGKLRGVRR